MENGYAYETKDTIYFDTSKLDKYGVLSRINIDEQKAGARVEFDSEKKNVTDFALWIKAPKEHIMQWDSFFGKCFGSFYSYLLIRSVTLSISSLSLVQASTASPLAGSL